MRASNVLSASEHKLVTAAIEAAENRTSAEVVVCLATRSGRYDRGEDLLGVVVALLSVAITWLLFQGAHDESWGLSVNIGLLPILGIFVVGFSAGAALAMALPALSLLFSSRAEMQSNVHDRARIAFQDLGVRGTRAATGVLIYVSLLERTVSVIGDDAIGEAIEQDGVVLAESMPGTHDDIDELENHLHIID